MAQVPRHAFALRKSLHICERFELEATAQQLLARHMAAHQRTQGVALPDAPHPLLADEEGLLAARHEALAQAALDETQRSVVAAFKALGARGAAGDSEGAATVQLANLLRAAGPQHYSGPSWLPAFFELLGLLRRGAAQLPRAKARSLVLQLCNDPTTPRRLLLRLLQLLAAPEWQQGHPPHAPMADSSLLTLLGRTEVRRGLRRPPSHGVRTDPTPGYPTPKLSPPLTEASVVTSPSASSPRQAGEPTFGVPRHLSLCFLAPPGRRTHLRRRGQLCDARQGSRDHRRWRPLIGRNHP